MRFKTNVIPARSFRRQHSCYLAPARRLPGLGFLLGVGLALSSAQLQAQTGTSGAPAGDPSAPNSQVIQPLGSGSNAPRVARLLLDRIRAALREKGLSATSKAGFHWVFLVQVANYPTRGDVRHQDRSSGLEELLKAIVESRRSWTPEERNDTIAVLRYHFDLLDRLPVAERSGISSYLNESGLNALFRTIPKTDSPGMYKGQLYKDGHDWRRSLLQTVKSLQEAGWTNNTVIVVLDWSDINQPPRFPANGGEVRPDRTGLLAAEDPDYINTLTAAGFNPSQVLRGDEVASFRYYTGVFVSKELKPLPTLTRNVARCADGTRRNPQTGRCDPIPASSSFSWGIVVAILVAVGAGAWLVLPGTLYLSEAKGGAPQDFKLSPLTGQLTIIGQGAESSPRTYVVKNDNSRSKGELAHIKMSLMRRISFTPMCGLTAGEGIEQDSHGQFVLREKPAKLKLHAPQSIAPTYAEIDIS